MKPKKTIVLLCLLSLSITSYAQIERNHKKKKIEFGSELQFYPVGFMPTITSNIFLKEKLALRLRIGGNFANRQDFSGFNDDEVAKGFGGSVGLVKYFPYWKGSFMVGATVDTWNMWTNWKDDLQSSNPQTGETYNLVVQPWINTGYLYRLSDKWNTGLSLGFGREINVITRGEKVGEGWMGILTVSTNYTFTD